MSKTKLKILVVEDDPIIAEDLYAYMNEFGYEPLEPVSNADDALKSMRIHSPDLCLLDVHLDGEIDGIQLASMIKAKKNVPIVFLTAFNDRDTIAKITEIKPAAYLVKPVEERNLQTAIELAFANALQEPKPHPVDVKSSESIFIKVKDKLTKFNFDDVLYFEAYDNYAFLFTKSEKHILSASLKQVEEKLPESVFIRTHRSYIVNINKIDGIGIRYLTIGKAEIPIGKTYKDALMNRIELL